MLRLKGFEVVGANGFEPSTSWSRTNRAKRDKHRRYNTPSEKQDFSPSTWLYLPVAGCVRLFVRSLQKSLHSRVGETRAAAL
jgi:hypothetical protein